MKSSTASSHGTLVVPRQLHVTGTTCFYILEVTTCIPCFRISQQQWHSCMPKIEAPRKGVTAYTQSCAQACRLVSGFSRVQPWLPFCKLGSCPSSRRPGSQRALVSRPRIRTHLVARGGGCDMEAFDRGSSAAATSWRTSSGGPPTKLQTLSSLSVRCRTSRGTCLPLLRWRAQLHTEAAVLYCSQTRSPKQLLAVQATTGTGGGAKYQPGPKLEHTLVL